MKTDDLREAYLAFFESKGCLRKPSDVLVPKGDPTVLFTPAGMNQFKQEFLGLGDPNFKRATTCQKCLRTGDIENVGNTAYHHTFFEMLGNFSFGDYFKKEAIHWAWEFLTEKKWLGLAADRLSVTVYLDDDEAYNLWRDEIKVPAGKIRREGEGENFWPASAPSQGPDGVCGPCSEIYYHPPGSSKSVEIWNLVFTQFNRVGPPPDNLKPLPKKNIDTGMGLERTAAVLQGHESNFEIDILRPLCEQAGNAVGVRYEFDGPQGRPLRRIADHLRAVTFCIHENVVPGPEKQSYIVRQLLRRAVLEAFLLGKQEPFLHTLVPAVAAVMRKPYPELTETAGRVAMVVKQEEEQFLRTVEKGLRKLENFIELARDRGNDVIPGDAAFDLHQTDGFLIEITEALAAKNNLRVDRGQYEKLMDEHRQKSGKDAFEASVMKAGPLDALRESFSDGSRFLGYDTTRDEGEVIGIIAEGHLVDSMTEVGHEKPVEVVLDRTPFYGEAGGQVGDTGKLVNPWCEFTVQDTQKHGGFVVHKGHLKFGKLQIGDKITAQVDDERRAGIRRAHSATHLLHHALQKTLGSHATQRGSKVDADWLRFDFTQPKAIAREELQRIEDDINEKVSRGVAVNTQVMDLEAARKSGATALFGEKYGDSVRVVSMGDFSRELCGGTHLSNTGQVGLCKIVGEESVAAGTRRVTALTGKKALEKIRQDETILHELAGLLKARPDDLPKRVAALADEVKQLKRDLTKKATQSAGSSAESLIESAVDVKGVKVVTHQADGMDVEALRGLIDQLRRKTSPLAVCLASVTEGRVTLIASLSKELVERGLNAVEWVKAAAQHVGGGGGGRPDMAQAGGKDASQLPQALAAAVEFLRGKL
jgi:alanyl-tRNA synthetase